ncbi:MAG: 2-C-methyl-D-erythritol 2,4-cyclodiphosphate synthase [Clostridia bacterium]|nr:2-C-methyl-D-erythritol 2,4-cyclodiphosphate synthase [Clostridia bacterium]MBR5265419.1 2-C-methyl-D-erythritol 2,4-cyclodiphosphate synthase [Clostridia bacterium]
MRIGNGYDVHKLVEGRDLILGGVKVPYEKGLLGHSDADVLAHAVIDAIIGALGIGDIGTHFPDTDEKYKGADSLVLLKRTGEMAKEMGYRIVNIDSIVVAQKPKLLPYIRQMRENMAAVLEMDPADVNVKAKTEEKLGFTGNLEGMKSYAVCIIEKT